MPQSSNQSPEDIHNAAKPGAPVEGSPETSSSHAAAAEPSGATGDNPSTAEPVERNVQSSTPENALGHLNPSAPEDANVTPGSATVK